MALYSDDVLNEVRNSVDLVELASAYVHLKRSGRSYMGCCPFHKEKTPSFHIDADKQLYYCFGCGAGGTVFQFVMAAEGLDFPDAVKFLAERGGVKLPDAVGDSDDIYRRKREMYAMNKAAARYFRDCLFSPEGEAARDYLRRRQLTSKTVASFGLGYAPKGWDGLLRHLEEKGFPKDMIAEVGLCIRNDRGHMYDRFRDRVMFPIFDVRQNIIGFGGRIMEGDGAKYMNSPESIIYDKGKNLFALNMAKKSKRNYYVLVEGYMDVISLHQAGIDCAVAGCGTALTEAQARLIAKGNTVYLCYDMDEAGQKALARASSIFNGLDAKLKVISIPDGKDADEFIKKYGGAKFEELLEDSSSVTDNKIDSLLRRYDTDDVGQTVELLNEAAPMLAEITNAMEREAYIRKLSSRTGISVQSITAEVAKAGRQSGRRQVRAQVLKSVSQSRDWQSPTKKSRREAAESKLLGILAEDRDVYVKIKDKLEPALFSEGLNRDIFEAIRDCYEGDEPSAEQFLMNKFEHREEELAAVIIKSDDPDNRLAAAGDYIDVIRDEDLAQRIAEAEKNGDVALLGQLIMNKHRKAGT